jgi:hypothetical protein
VKEYTIQTFEKGCTEIVESHTGAVTPANFPRIAANDSNGFDVDLSEAPAKPAAIPAKSAAPAPAAPAPAASAPSSAPNFSNADSLVHKPAPNPVTTADPRPVWARLKCEPGIVSAVAELKAGEAALVAERSELRALSLNPGQAAFDIADLKAALTGDLTPAEMQAVTAKLAHLSAIAPEMTHAASQRIGKRVEELRVAALNLIALAEPIFQEYLDAAVESEAAFFAGHGLPRTATAVSGRVASAQRALAESKASLSIDPARPARQPHENSWTWMPSQALAGII